MAALRFCGVLALVALAVLLPGYIATKIQTGFKSLISSRSSQIEFLGKGGALAEFDRESLQSRISDAANAGKSLDELAKIAGSLAPLSRVEVVRTSPEKIVIGFERRTPSMRIDRGSTLRLIDSGGFIYGSCCQLPAQEAESQLPLLTGLSAAEDGGLSPREERTLIGEALGLNGGLIGKGIRVASLRYQNHRGFFTVMDPEGIEVSMGRAPFEDKLNRLAEVLLRIDRQKVSRIELDYHGKAFIKERKL